MPESIKRKLERLHPDTDIARLIGYTFWKLSKDHLLMGKVADELGVSRSGLWRFLNNKR